MRLPLLIAITASLFLLEGCGIKGKEGPVCLATNVGDGATVNLELIGANSYKMTLCTDIAGNNTYSVYGGPTLNDVTPVSSGGHLNIGNKRAGPIQGASNAGATIQIDFNSSDVFFAVFLDDSLGQPAFTNRLVYGRITNR